VILTTPLYIYTFGDLKGQTIKRICKGWTIKGYVCSTLLAHTLKKWILNKHYMIRKYKIKKLVNLTLISHLYI